MRIAWLIGNPFDEKLLKNYVNKHNNSGGWVYTQLFALAEREDIDQVTIISVSSSYKTDSNYIYGKFNVFCIKGKSLRWDYSIKTSQNIDRILEVVKPDILDVQGVEITTGAYSVYKKVSVPVINTIHGVAFQCERAYFTGLPRKSLILDRTIKDNLTLHGVLEAGIFMRKRALLEEYILKNIKYVRGRTNWDEICVKSINPNLCYFHVELILREFFYTTAWNIDTCKRNQIFIPQCHIPYKGLYIFLQTLEIIKKSIPDIMVHIPGQPFRNDLKRNGFDKFISNEIRKRGLQDNIVFLGYLNSEEMVKQLQLCRVFVLPSIIENSPNSLAEAQMVGVPCVASLVGGTPEYVRDGENGFLYNSLDPYMCADRVIRLMKDEETSKVFSQNARSVALKRHDPKACTQALADTYYEIIDNA